MTVKVLIVGGGSAGGGLLGLTWLEVSLRICLDAIVAQDINPDSNNLVFAENM
jgi:hypothetical protein